MTQESSKNEESKTGTKETPEYFSSLSESLMDEKTGKHDSNVDFNQVMDQFRQKYIEAAQSNNGDSLDPNMDIRNHLSQELPQNSLISYPED